MKNKIDINSWLIGIACSIIATLIYNNVPNLATSIVQVGGGVQDLQYAMAGKANDNTLTSCICAAFVGMLFGFAIPEILSRLVKLCTLNNSKRKKSGDIDNIEGLSFEQLKLEYQHLNDDLKNKRENMTRAQSVLVLCVAISCLLLAIVFSFLVIQPVNIKESFDREIIKIKPYISEIEVEQLNSKWVQISDKKDYMILINQIDTIKKINEIH